MADNNTGGMFSKLINPDTAQPKTTKKPDINTLVGADIKPEAETVVTHSPIPAKKLTDIEKLAALKARKTIKRKQISAYLLPEQLSLLKQLYFRLNSGDVEVEKSEIIGLGIEVIHQLLSTKVLRYSSTNQIRKYLNTQISKYLGTQVPKDSDT